MSIKISSAIGSADLIELPPLNQNGLCELTYLHSGDVTFIGKHTDDENISIGIEVKRLDDLMSSAKSGRLQDTQISNMIKTFDSSWIISYGIYRKTEDNEILWYRGDKGWQTLRIRNLKWNPPYAYLQSILVEIQELGIKHIHVHNKIDVADWIYRIYKWRQKPWNQHKFMKVFKSEVIGTNAKEMLRTVREPEAILKIAKFATGFDGVSYIIGVRAAVHFGSVKSMMEGSEEDWKQIEGVGSGLAFSIQRQITEEV